jgi:hypothetical protein
MNLQRPDARLPSRLFPGFFMGGFECSTHRLKSGRRLDLIAATQHDRFCDLDYARLRDQGIRVAREGARWHLIEAAPGRFDFSSALPMVLASRKHQVLVLWDLCHYGWPDVELDIFSPEFVTRFARYAGKFAAWLSGEMSGPFFFAPINEISFFSWAGGDVPHLNPYCRGRGSELKRQLVRAAIEGMEAVWVVIPDARFLQIDPLIHIVPKENRPKTRAEALGYRNAQFEAFDMLAGRVYPELGGAEKYLDIIGLNYYPNNQWIYQGRALTPKDPRYRPLRDLLREVRDRYRRSMFIAETGTEGRRRPAWLRYVCEETRAAMESGVPIDGICLYPIVNHPGWVNRRHCHNGLWDYPGENGERQIYAPLADELQAWRGVFEHGTSPSEDRHLRAGAEMGEYALEQTGRTE